MNSKEKKTAKTLIEVLEPYFNEVTESMEALLKRLEHEKRCCGPCPEGTMCSAHNIRDCDVCVAVDNE
jgi:tRNA(Phe) wybutosine-synthesizing methylase Tyw3